MTKPAISAETKEERDLLFHVFLHVNRELNDFQRSVLRLVFAPPKDDPDRVRTYIGQALVEINRQVNLLQSSGWKPEKKEGDQVNKPDHYDRFPMEPTYFIVTSGGFHWTVENFCKYIVRYRFKNGLEDLKKAMRNLAMYSRFLDGDPNWSR